MAFVLAAISDHKGSADYRLACDADMYYKHLNPTIMRYQKYVYDLMGRSVPDIYSANNKIPCRYYFYFITQEVQFLLGNGVGFNDDATKEKLGAGFDSAIQKATTEAVNGGVSFLFWNNDHVEQFSLTEFVPLYDEENGALRSGIRFWQIDSNKPLRATLYEEDGYTEYIRRQGEDMTVLTEKRPYVEIVQTSGASGEQIVDGTNYDGFPIVPLYNINKQSELIGNRETIDAYDLMASALINNIDDANIIYWVIKNAGGMDDLDDMKFVQRLKTLHTVHVEDGQEVDKHEVNVQFEASEAALRQLRSQLFDDFMALDVKEIASGATTATQIKAAYEPLNSKTDLLEYQVTDAIKRILALVGIDDEPTYTRSMIINQQETITNLVSAAEYLSSDYITRKILETLGDTDSIENVLAEKVNEDVSRFSGTGETENEV